MHRRFSTLLKSSGEPSAVDNSDAESKVSTVREVDIPPPVLKVKRVDHYYSRWSKGWKYRNTSAKISVEARPLMSTGDNDPWKDSTFVVVRKIPRQENLEPTFKIVVKSEHILQVCKDVIQSWPGISWNSDPLELDPEMLLTYLPPMIAYRDALSTKSAAAEEKHRQMCVSLLINTLQTDYRNTLATIHSLTSHGEIKFDYLYAILIPRTTFIARCAITGEPRLLTLTSFLRTSIEGKLCYQLTCESVDITDSTVIEYAPDGTPANTNNASGQASNGSAPSGRVGKVQTVIRLTAFKGTIPIVSLDCYPLKYHADPEGVKRQLVERGKKWLELATGGAKHVQYRGIAALKCGDKVIRHNIDGRIMIDRATFRRLNANYQFPQPVPPAVLQHNDPANFHARMRNNYDDEMESTPIPAAVVGNNGIQTSAAAEADIDLTDDQLCLAPAVVYGFSLSDKVWLEFDVQKITPVEWSVDAFANLVLPQDRKDLLQSLVEAHHRELGFDDFIKGKGQGLVINLFGPPGVGKTFSAEATSEHVKRPLYVIGGGDLGTKASDLDTALERVFDVATAWKAIVLIDEADVFLEQRSLHDLERNAMVAVFLRHVEYYRGILFLTTNRVKAFDEAFLSRIHVALHFHELNSESKKQVWIAFIKKAGAGADISDAEIEHLSKRDVNGRQIKNAVRTAQSLAVARGEKIAFRHMMETLDAMDEFTKQFDEMRAHGTTGTVQL